MNNHYSIRRSGIALVVLARCGVTDHSTFVAVTPPDEKMTEGGNFLLTGGVTFQIYCDNRNGYSIITGMLSMAGPSLFQAGGPFFM